MSKIFQVSGILPPSMLSLLLRRGSLSLPSFQIFSANSPSALRFSPPAARLPSDFLRQQAVRPQIFSANSPLTRLRSLRRNSSPFGYCRKESSMPASCRISSITFSLPIKPSRAYRAR